ncbi:hypothetical protein [Nocardia sp. NPDC048505]|uniref:hypothetical protein n=1 Tax=unclassified Nocardia TaxID=2637762 RepID=UPI0034117ED3
MRRSIAAAVLGGALVLAPMATAHAGSIPGQNSGSAELFESAAPVGIVCHGQPMQQLWCLLTSGSSSLSGGIQS